MQGFKKPLNKSPARPFPLSDEAQFKDLFRVSLNLLCLLVLAAATISLGCSQEGSEPETAAQSDADVPSATAAPVTETIKPTPTVILTEVPAATAAPVTETANPMPTIISTEVAAPPRRAEG